MKTFGCFHMVIIAIVVMTIGFILTSAAMTSLKMTNEQILSEMNDVHEKLDRCLCIVETHMEALQVPHVRLNEAVSWLRDAMRDVRRVRSSITAEPYKKKDNKKDKEKQ